LPWDPEYEKKTVGIPLSYVIMNDKASKLGTHPLLPGKARIFMPYVGGVSAYAKTCDAVAAAGYTGFELAV